MAGSNFRQSGTFYKEISVAKKKRKKERKKIHERKEQGIGKREREEGEERERSRTKGCIGEEELGAGKLRKGNGDRSGDCERKTVRRNRA